MINVLSVVKEMEQERERQNIFPSHISYIALQNEVIKRLQKEINQLVKENKLSFCNTLNTIAVKVVENKSPS